MAQYNVAVEVVTAAQSVLPADVPAAIRVTLNGEGKEVAYPGPFSYAFVIDGEGTYQGVVQAVRADGTDVGAPVVFEVTTSNPLVEVQFPAGVSVTVTVV